MLGLAGIDPPHRRLEQAPSQLWAAVDRLVDRAPSLADLSSHRLELLAARRWRSLGMVVPPEVVDKERRAAVVQLAAPVLLGRVRAAYDGELVLVKGLDVARRYPEPGLRAFGDLDLIADDAASAQRALLAAGFQEVGDPSLYEGIHHLRPLQLPELPLVVELHSRPKWVEGIPPPPPTDDLLASAIPGPHGFHVLPAAHHALLLAAHSWAHEPLRRLRDIVDIAAVAEAAGRQEVAELARSWQVERLWGATEAVAEAVLYDRRRPLALRLWAQNLETARERTVLENHLQRWFSDFWIMPPHRAIERVPATLAAEFFPEGGEGWGSKLSRSGRAIRNATRRRSEHDEELAQWSRRKR
jgi:Uncharacterised nucleotidyltransferase